MTDNTNSAKPSRVKVLGIWILRILLTLAFGAAALAKLSGAAMMVAEFEKIGLGQWFRYVTGVTELVAIILVLWPRTTFFGALILLCVCVGAFVAQIGPLHGDVVHVVIMGGLVGVTIWLARPQSA